MAGFDFSAITKLTAPSIKTYSALVDALDIQKNQLEADGKLSPGDYDLLTKRAMDAYLNPGLTAEQRGNVMVKISGYKSDKQKTILSQNNDVERLNRELKDDKASIGMAYGNNPQMLIKAHADAMHAKLSRLSESINNLQNAGDDATNHIMEYNAGKNDYYDLLNAYEDVKNYKGAGLPTGNYVAYVDTNPRGEILNVSVGRPGSKTGYYETNGLYGGLQIYGNKTRKEGDQAIFQIGNNVFKNADITVPDAQGVMKPAVLVSGVQQLGGRTLFRGEKYQDVDLGQVSTQSAFRSGDWLQGKFLYQKDDNGYIKHLNPDKTKLGVTDNNIMPIPQNLENSILNNVYKTVDDSKPYVPPTPSVPAVASSTPVTPGSAPASTSLTDKILQRNAAPIERSPQTALGTAANVIKGAGSFLSKLFGIGQ